MMKQYKPLTENLGPYEDGLRVQMILSSGEVVEADVPITPDPDWWHVNETNDRPAVGSYEEQITVLADYVDLTYVATGVTLEQAKATKQQEIDNRWAGAVIGGIPVTVQMNGDSITALLSYEQVDRLIWQSHSYGMPAPPGGLLIGLKEPISAPGYPFDGADEFSISGQARLDTAKIAIRDHVNQAGHAWKDATDAVRAATTVAEVQAIDVDSYNWPKNEVPAP